MPVLPVMSRLWPSEIFRLRSLTKGLLEAGAQMETRSRRKAVSAGSTTGHSGALRSEDKGREVVSPAGGGVFSLEGAHLWTEELLWAKPCSQNHGLKSQPPVPQNITAVAEKVLNK